MNRRTFLGFCGTGFTVGVAGCGVSPNVIGDEPDPRVDFYLRVDRVDDEWLLKARVRSHDDTSIDGVTLIAFSDQGEEVCRTQVGDFEAYQVVEHTVEITCKTFPAIVSGTAAETPCDGANIQITYWVGDPEQVELSGENETILWESTYRECDEPLPPERVIEKVEETPDN